MRLAVGRRPRQRSEHNGSPASRIRGIRAPTEGRVSRFSCPKIAAGGQASQLSKLSEIKDHEVFRIDNSGRNLIDVEITPDDEISRVARADLFLEHILCGMKFAS